MGVVLWIVYTAGTKPECDFAGGATPYVLQINHRKEG